MMKSKMKKILKDHWDGFVKIYVDNWIDGMLSKLINARHRHIVFTIPEELREYLGKDREKLKILTKCAAKAVTSWMRELNKKEEFMRGILTVIHLVEIKNGILMYI